MMDTVAPPQLSKEEIAQLEAEANFTVQQFTVGAIVLYLCKDFQELRSVSRL